MQFTCPGRQERVIGSRLEKAEQARAFPLWRKGESGRVQCLACEGGGDSWSTQAGFSQ